MSLKSVMTIGKVSVRKSLGSERGLLFSITFAGSPKLCGMCLIKSLHLQVGMEVALPSALFCGKSQCLHITWKPRVAVGAQNKREKLFGGGCRHSKPWLFSKQ